MMKTEKAGMVRKGLTDITNSHIPPQPPPLPPAQKLPLTPTSKSHVEKLLLENAALIKLIQERDKMVEVSGVALQKLRVNYQKLQAQNNSLAKSNTQILTELNSVKDKLKVLQHELACKNAVLKARDVEPEEKVKMRIVRLNVASQEEEEEATRPPCDQITAIKPSTQSRRKSQQRQSLGAPSTHAKDDEKLKVPNRRQSGRFQTQVLEPEENLFEIEEAKFPITQPGSNKPKPDQESEITCPSPPKEGKESISSSTSVKETTKRSSMGRPLRRAAEKVQSYKEIPLNIKMRRLE
ncbi:hypothetical protein MLD38_004047 [Melastoma candidum]|uniref:Uncharacterized protein n=1 Tax=Melastoma candidum TaxID=119954 RepID=A0ACB9S6F0_9MYRT|nr:hypothetical protein MLD38_004047 [Melastoma candidum]